MKNMLPPDIQPGIVVSVTGPSFIQSGPGYVEDKSFTAAILTRDGEEARAVILFSNAQTGREVPSMIRAGYEITFRIKEDGAYQLQWAGGALNEPVTMQLSEGKTGTLGEGRPVTLTLVNEPEKLHDFVEDRISKINEELETLRQKVKRLEPESAALRKFIELTSAPTLT